MRQGDEMIVWLVEPDVTIGADAEDLDIDATRSGNRFFITPALSFDIVYVPAEKVDAIRLDVEPREQLVLHHASEAAGMRRLQANKLIKIERRHSREIDFATGVSAF